MILYPNCKINIGLRVISKRADGYHNIETVFYPVHGLHDRLEITPADHFCFEQSGLVVDCEEQDNLIVRCYRQMRSHYPQIGNVHIRFDKQIPFGAGLGGGSSDAAHTAIALNELFHLGLDQHTLANEVSTLGADCAFFIYNTPCLAEGIGDRLTPIHDNLSSLRLIMLKPQVHISTRDAYQGIHLSAHLPSLALQVRNGLNPAMLTAHADIIYNDFENTVFPLHPELSRIKQALLQQGAIYAAMSGSGSTVYGLFEDNAEGRTMTYSRLLDEDLAAMVIFNDTLA